MSLADRQVNFPFLQRKMINLRKMRLTFQDKVQQVGCWTGHLGGCLGAEGEFVFWQREDLLSSAFRFIEQISI